MAPNVFNDRITSFQTPSPSPTAQPLPTPSDAEVGLIIAAPFIATVIITVGVIFYRRWRVTRWAKSNELKLDPAPAPIPMMDMTQANEIAGWKAVALHGNPPGTPTNAPRDQPK